MRGQDADPLPFQRKNRFLQRICIEKGNPENAPHGRSGDLRTIDVGAAAAKDDAGRAGRFSGSKNGSEVSRILQILQNQYERSGLFFYKIRERSKVLK